MYTLHVATRLQPGVLCKVPLVTASELNARKDYTPCKAGLSVYCLTCLKARTQMVSYVAMDSKVSPIDKYRGLLIHEQY